MTLSRELHHWVESMRAAGLSKDTIYLRSAHVRRVISTIDKSPASVTEADLLAYFGSQDWKPETRRSYRASIRLFYSWFEAAGRGDNVAENLPRIQPHRSLPRPAEDSVILQALREAPPRVQLMMELMAYGGLRRGEVSRVHSSQLVGEWLEVIGKGGHTRLVPLPGHLCERIRKSSGWLFPGQIDGHMSPAYVGKLVSQALPDGVTAHMLRHRFATVTYKRSKDIRAVQGLLGHAKLDTTMIYVDVDDVTRRTAASQAWALGDVA